MWIISYIHSKKFSHLIKLSGNSILWKENNFRYLKNISRQISDVIPFSRVVTCFMLAVFFYTPWKHQKVSWCIIHCQITFWKHYCLIVSFLFENAERLATRKKEDQMFGGRTTRSEKSLSYLKRTFYIDPENNSFYTM